MKVEFVPNVEGKDMLQVCGISEERFNNDIDPKMKQFLAKMFDDDDYQPDHLLRDFLSIAETPGEFAFLAFMAGRKTEEFDNMCEDPLMAIMANALNQ